MSGCRIDWPRTLPESARASAKLAASEADGATHTHGTARRSTKYFVCGSVVVAWWGCGAARGSAVAVLPYSRTYAGRHSISEANARPPGPGASTDGRRRGLGFTWLATTTASISS